MLLHCLALASLTGGIAIATDDVAIAAMRIVISMDTDLYI